MLNTVLIITQLFFTIIVGIYFWGQLQIGKEDKDGIKEDSKHIAENLNRLRKISLSEPLTEQTRPSKLDEIIGQDDGVEALKTALCGKNPQHILIYGPPGVGKTAASRVALSYAKTTPDTPFKKDAKFVEVDATIMQYDERSIADPLIGSVHDPIYQGAGAYGASGIPQPKEGAVTKAHGGVLFIDEIGELSSIQINRLLKVLEDRKVMFESAYYSTTNKNIPTHIHDIFKNGYPADFRLIGATTKSPQEIPDAIRSRCTEIFFNPLKKEDILKIIDNALSKLNMTLDDSCKKMICRYVNNGRDTVRILETLSARLKLNNKDKAQLSDIQWIIDSGRYTPNYYHRINEGTSIGRVNALAVIGSGMGLVIPIEAVVRTSKTGGKVSCGGITESESIKKGSQTFIRTSTAKTSLQNVMTVLKTSFDTDESLFDIYVNIPGGIPVEGPSAGVALFMCIYSAIFQKQIDNQTAFTGELSIKGDILGVGGIKEKVESAVVSGAKRVFIPKSNYCEQFQSYDAQIIGVENIFEAIELVFNDTQDNSSQLRIAKGPIALAKSDKET